MDKSDSEILDEMDFSVYTNVFKSVMPDDIDIHYFNRKSVSDELKSTFNKVILTCNSEFSLSILSILVELSTKYIEPKTLAGLINSRVKHELMEEIRVNHSFVDKYYYNNTLFDFFH